MAQVNTTNPQRVPLKKNTLVDLSNPIEMKALNDVLNRIVTLLNLHEEQLQSTTSAVVNSGILSHQSFTGNGTKTRFDLDSTVAMQGNGVTPVCIFVFKALIQLHSVHYAVSNISAIHGRVIFTQAPRNGESVQIYWLPAN